MAWWQEFSIALASASALGLLAAIARWTGKSYRRFVSMDESLRQMGEGFQLLRRRTRRLVGRMEDVEEAIGDQAEQLADHEGRLSHLETKEGISP